MYHNFRNPIPLGTGLRRSVKLNPKGPLCAPSPPYYQIRIVQFFVFGAALWFQAGCSSGEPATAIPASPPSNPMVRVFQIPPRFVEETTRLEYDAPVKNETGRFVRFTGVQRSCSCTAAELGARELSPGEATTLHFDIDLRHRKGPQKFVCRLLEEGGPEWTYALETTLYERAHFAETGMTHFGMTDPNAEETRETAFFLIRSRRWGSGIPLPGLTFFRPGDLGPAHAQSLRGSGGRVLSGTLERWHDAS